MVIGVAVGLFTTVSMLLSVWLVAPFFHTLLLLLLAGSALAGTVAAKRLRLPRLRWWAIILVILVSWPVATILPYATLVGEVHLRVELPPLPPDATKVEIRASPLAGGTSSGPAPGFVAEYWTPLSLDLALNSLMATLPMEINRHEDYLYAIPNPDQAQVVIAADGSGSRVKVGVFGDYTSALPWSMFLGAWICIAVMFLVSRRR